MRIKRESTYRSVVVLKASEHRKFKRYLAEQRLSINKFLRSKVLEVINAEK
jgi:hypothetical protein